MLIHANAYKKAVSSGPGISSHQEGLQKASSCCCPCPRVWVGASWHGHYLYEEMTEEDQEVVCASKAGVRTLQQTCERAVCRQRECLCQPYANATAVFLWVTWDDRPSHPEAPHMLVRALRCWTNTDPHPETLGNRRQVPQPQLHHVMWVQHCWHGCVGGLPRPSQWTEGGSDATTPRQRRTGSPLLEWWNVLHALSDLDS